MVERHTSPTVSAWIRFKVGSVDERSDERGVAHLLEHMLFKGTKTLGTKDYSAEKPLLDRIEIVAQDLVNEKARQGNGDKAKIAMLQKELSRLEEEAGKYVVKEEFADLYSRNGGSNYNAFTSKDGTTYLIGLPSNKLELWAAIESDRMQNAVLREFYTERDVVMEERRRSYDAEPAGRLWETFLATAFVAHPVGQPIIGWMSDIENLTRTKAENFLKSYYAPNNAIIAIVGDINPAKTVELVERYFGGISPGKPVPPVAVTEPRQQGEKRVEIIGDAEPELMIGFHKPTLTIMFLTSLTCCSRMEELHVFTKNWSSKNKLPPRSDHSPRLAVVIPTFSSLQSPPGPRIRYRKWRKPYMTNWNDSRMIQSLIGI
jgi:predicted Zn-dependent peptidase